MDTMIISATSLAPSCAPATIAKWAEAALLEEVWLTPKPGLVDGKSNGCHGDLNLALMERSAHCLRPVFHDMAVAAMHGTPSLALRERLAVIGRYGEQLMLETTDGINTHKGAIWCLGLLSAAASILGSRGMPFTTNEILETAGWIASFEDRYAPVEATHGSEVRKTYGVTGAREEAMLGFPSIRLIALPVWREYAHEPERIRRLNVLIALMSMVDDTCILHRSNLKVLHEVQFQARVILQQGGVGPRWLNWRRYRRLAEVVVARGVSPGGSADLLAATIFVKKVSENFKID